MTLPLLRVRSLLPMLAIALVAMASAGTTAPLGAQEQPVAGDRPLTPFTAMRVAIMPLQLWRADTTAWSKSVEWSTVRIAIDSAIADELQARGLGRRWAYATDVARSAKRNPTYASDPYALGVSRWRATPPKPGDQVPSIVADNLRPLTALGDTRYALVPVELRAEGAQAVLRLVLVDTRGRTVVWGSDLVSLGGKGLVATIARDVADLIIEP